MRPRLLLVLSACAIGLHAQAPVLPFAPGERLIFDVKVGLFGTLGRSAMWIEGPTERRGTAAWLLRFDLDASRGPVRATDRTSSWFDPVRGASLRYEKTERYLLAKRAERVEIDPLRREWRPDSGALQTSPSDRPLDELSFIYFVRTLPLALDSTYRFERHFDSARNPTFVRVHKRETITTRAGTFATLAVEMRVRGGSHYEKEGTVLLNLSDDAARTPIRMISKMPVIGTVTLLLAERHEGARTESSIGRSPTVNPEGNP
ncbi:MAG: DUF3108 domain-containing protein [Gemmatimonadaceae bacterium]|nr:DUF3108 domain-containing protein [Gemmatimonadaceae bacterium]